MENNKNTDNLDNANLIHFRRSCQWRAAFFGLLTLVSGIIIGAASMMIFAPEQLIQNTSGTEFRALGLMPSLRRNLELSPAQVNQIRPILNKHMTNLNQIREQARADISSVLIELNQEVSSLLTDRQNRIWQQELIRLQRDLNPQPLRGGRGMGQQRRGQGRGQQGIGGNMQRGLLQDLLQDEPNSLESAETIE